MTPARFARLSQILDRRQLDLTVVMENVRKPHNIGAIVRTCDAVGIHQIHAVVAPSSERETPAANFTPTKFSTRAQSAAGSGRYVSIQPHLSIMEATTTLKSSGYTLITADIATSAVDYRKADLTAPIALILGSEGSGLTADARTFADFTVSIPMLGAVRSLNVSVAAAIILFEAQRQRLERGCYSQPDNIPSELRRRLLFEWGYPRVAHLYRTKGIPYPPLGTAGELQS